jgi:glycosyltransferase involved in cell wall biosynthesis
MADRDGGQEVAERIVFLNGADGFWGAEQSLAAIASGIAKTGISVELIVREPAWALAMDGVANVSVRLLKGRSGLAQRSITYVMPLLHVGPRTTVVVFDLRLTPIAALLRRWLRLRGARLVVDLHDAPVPEQRLHRCIEFARRADACVCVSDFVASQVKAYTDAFVVKRPVTPLDARHHETDLPVVGVIGRLDPEKRLEFSIEALARAAEHASFDVVIRGGPSWGDPDYASGVIRLAEERLGDRVRYEGVVTHDVVLDGIDILLVASDREPSGRTVAEAQASGVAVVVPDAGGVREFVIDGRDGLTYESTSIDSAASAVAVLANDDELRDRLRRGGLNTARTEYHPDVQAEKYGQIVAVEIWRRA